VITEMRLSCREFWIGIPELKVPLSHSRQAKAYRTRKLAKRCCLIRYCVKFTTEHAMEEITSTELKQRLDNGDDIQLIDVREGFELAIAKIPNAIHIPLAQVLARMDEIDPNRETVVHCKMGGRSARAIDALQRSGFTGKLINLKGGIIGWSNEVDPTVPKY
jgi:rhodanese-related sulfurtransferase